MRPVHSAVLTVCCALALAAPAAASIPVDVRVEGANGRNLTADRYLTDTTSITTTQRPPNCNGTGATKTIAGRTALGALVDGERVDRRLDPLLVSDEFSFGLLVCGIGGDEASGSSFWLYKVNHVSPEVGADQFAVKRGDDVLWFFSGGAQNSGNELELLGPARVRPGEEFQVQVNSYDFQGTRSPAAGVTVAGGGASAVTNAFGTASLTLERPGNRTLRATHDPDIPSAPTKVCVNEDLSKCSRAPGARIWGSRRGERIAGSAGPDRVRAGGGNDRISVRRGSRDRVRCGRGRDRVLAGTRDRVAADCEVVRLRGRL